ncbi:hypothetical protein RJO76_000812 [Aeromonas veronii]|uniref:hypothetical protein n=1 Tax=Aeromonas veronii TaxID=654 RepID=UPI0028661E92|nr:hypothetical protein [Aeromonas veronii]
MSSKPQLPIEKISQLAADIREINNYAENHGFDAGLLHAQVTPSSGSISRNYDWSLISLVGFSCLLIALLYILTFYEPISSKVANFLFVSGMFLVVGASTAAHKKFENSIITSIICIGFLGVLLVGSGVFTPREAVEQLQEMRK